MYCGLTTGEWLVGIPLLLQGVWDLVIGFESFYTWSDWENGTQFAANYLATNFVTLVLRIGLFLSGFNRTDALLVVMSLIWLTVQILAAREQVVVSVCNPSSHLNSTLVMSFYHGAGFVCGLISLIIYFANSDKVALARIQGGRMFFQEDSEDSEKNSEWRKTSAVDITSGCGVKVLMTDEPFQEATFSSNSLSRLTQFVRRRFKSKNKVGRAAKMMVPGIRADLQKPLRL